MRRTFSPLGAGAVFLPGPDSPGWYETGLWPELLRAVGAEGDETGRWSELGRWSGRGQWVQEDGEEDVLAG